MGMVGGWVASMFVLMMVLCSEVSVILDGVGGSTVKGMSQRPFGLRLPVMMIALFFRILNWYLEKIVIQSSSHNFPMDINDPVFRLSNKKACCALSFNLADKGIFASEWGVMVLPFSTVTGGPFLTCMLVQNYFSPPCR